MKAKFKVLWSKESKLQFDKVIAYLRDEWTEKEVDKFILILRTFEEVVSEFPELYAESKAGIRRAILTKHHSVIYRIDKKDALIRVYTIFDNRQHPNKME